jgi:hypothetical protein
MNIKIPTFSILRPSKIYPNWDFGFENKPSGNPAMHWPRQNCYFPPLNFFVFTVKVFLRRVFFSCLQAEFRLDSKSATLKTRQHFYLLETFFSILCKHFLGNATKNKNKGMDGRARVQCPMELKNDPTPRIARFFLVRDTKTGKMYQINTQCTKWS